MTAKKSFNAQAAHKFFSKSCFNAAWRLLDKGSRTSEENEEMIRLSQSALFHWSQRTDCTDQNLSIGYWQLARIYAVLGDASAAVKYGQKCVDYSQKHGVAKVFLGYAYEALARAYAVSGDEEKKVENIKMAREIADALSEEDKAQLTGDLDTI
jgi:tetratricopeptide (TPR) repeat protein